MSKKIQLPQVLSIQRCMNLTDGRMFSLLPEADGERELPVAVVRHGIRGVLGAPDAEDNAAAKGTSNIQVTESAKLDPEALGLVVRFSIKPLPLDEALFACNVAAYAEGFRALVSHLQSSASLREVCRRYAHNILSGRWLWRNRVLGKPEVTAHFNDQTLRASGWKLDGFAEHEHSTALGKYLQDSFDGTAGGGSVIEVTARIQGPGLAQMEVYPSQNMVSGKPRGFARPLYKINAPSIAELRSVMRSKSELEFADTLVMGQAALRDQKIGNAIRTIDSWYTDDSEAEALPVEPNGASLRHNEFFRTKSKGNTAFSLLGNLDDLLERAAAAKSDGRAEPDLMYVTAMIIRGGVLSGDKKDDAEKSTTGKTGKTGKASKKAGDASPVEAE